MQTRLKKEKGIKEMTIVDRKERGIEVIGKGRPDFPARLAEIKDCPKELYYIGNLDALQKPCVSIVGSRTTTEYGRKTARSIAIRLAERGVTIVSGMAKGIDSVAHRGTIAAGGMTAAVLGCGPDQCYPKENRQLKEQIEQTGIVLSEYPPGTEPIYYNFPQRNRIISGLSEMTVVVQARNRSGSLITAELAIEQGREVYAVPGNIDSMYNLGSNKLIKEGAFPIISVDDVLEPLGLRKVSRKEAEQQLSFSEFEIFKLLEERGELSPDEICMYLGKSPGYISPMLSVMEIKGFIFSSMGKFFLANT